MGKSYYKTKADVYSAPLKDKIDRLLYINAKSCEQSLKNIIRNKDYSLNDVKEKNLDYEYKKEVSKVKVNVHSGVKCERCWKYSEEVGNHAEHSTICPRCIDAITK